MDRQRYDRGLAVRTQVLGEEYVRDALNDVDEFNQEFQELITEFCWGACWGDPTLAARERSILNLGMIAALNRMHEWELHLRGAIRNGLTQTELKTILHQITVYCGVPTGVECFRIARRVRSEDKPA